MCSKDVTKQPWSRRWSDRVATAALAGLPVRVFVTHSHGDHWDPVVLNWREQIDDIAYIFGWQWDVADDVISLPAPRATQAGAYMEYLREAADLGKRPVDLVFLGAWLGEPARLILDGLQPQTVYPMHNGGKEKEYKEFAAECREAGYTFSVPCPERRGQVFTYTGTP